MVSFITCTSHPVFRVCNLNEAIISTVLASMLLSAIVAVTPNVSPIYQAAFTIPAIVMESTMVCKMLRVMCIRSLDADLNASLPQAEWAGFELDTSFELYTRTTDDERDRTW